MRTPRRALHACIFAEDFLVLANPGPLRLQTGFLDGIIGCPHEEGIDYPEGKSCPQCPYWARRARPARIAARASARLVGCKRPLILAHGSLCYPMANCTVTHRESKRISKAGAHQNEGGPCPEQERPLRWCLQPSGTRGGVCFEGVHCAKGETARLPRQRIREPGSH